MASTGSQPAEQLRCHAVTTAVSVPPASLLGHTDQDEPGAVGPDCDREEPTTSAGSSGTQARPASSPRKKVFKPPSSPRKGTIVDGPGGRVIGLPQWHFPSELPPPPATDFSIISQVDGLIFKCQGLRVERDMRAVQAKSAFCDHIGMERYESTGSFVGWYHADPLLHMPGIVATVASHQGIGVFIVPAEPAPQSTGIRLCEGGGCS
jgi:hypothetical protein